MSTTGKSSDRNLLFGILAVQMDFIGRDALVTAMGAWILAKNRSLGQILLEQGALRDDARALLEALVSKHLEMHDNDPEKSLAAVSSISSVREELHQIVDADVQASLAQVSVDRKEIEEDPQATKLVSVGASTSSGLRFRILRPHARGGLGEVFVAHDEELHREVALKEIQGRHASHPESRSRFMLEAEITGGLEHPGIVPVYGLGQYGDGRPYYAMRFIKGDSLKEAIHHFHEAEASGENIGEKALELRKLLQRFIDVCNAIAYAHSRGILHRDLKPGNIMLGKYGETLVVDWGLAKPLDRATKKTTDSSECQLKPSSASGSTFTQMGTVVGTPAYMSPEQAAGRHDLLGTASDVYSLGATLYTLLTGKVPFEERELGLLLQKLQRGDFRPPRQVKKDVPAALEAICLKAMSLRPEDRYGSPKALADDIEHWRADEPVSAFREPVSARLGRWGRRHRTLVTGGAVLLVSAVAALTLGLLLLGRKQAEVVQERDSARKARDQSEAIVKFYEVEVLAAARPKGWEGGAGKDVTLKEALDNAVPKIKKAFDGQPELEATVRNTLGMTYWYLGQFEAANPHLEEAYRIRLKSLGEDHPDTLASLHNLAMQRWKQDRTVEAVPLARKALEGRRRVLGPEHEDTLFTQLNLGLFLTEEYRYEESEPLLRSAIEACKRSLGIDHHHTLYGQNDLAVVLYRNGKYQESLELNRMTLEGRRRSLGPDHPDTLRSMANLACSLWHVNKLDEGETLCRQGLKARQRVLGEVHTETLWSLDNLAGILADEGKLEEAEQIRRDMVENCQRDRGTDDPETLICLTDLSSFLQDQGKAEEAEKLLRQSIDLSTRKLGAEHSSTLNRKSLMASLLKDQCRYVEAEALYRQTLETQRRVSGAEDSRTLSIRNDLATLLAAWGKLDEAEALVRDTLEIRRHAIGVEKPETLASQHNLAWVSENQGRWEEAERVYRETLEIRRRALGRENASTLLTQKNLARVLAEQGKLEEAERLYRQALETQRHTLGLENPGTLNTQNSMALFLGEHGKRDEAEKLYRHSLEVAQRTLGKEHPFTLDTRTELADLLGNEGKREEMEALFRNVLEVRRRMFASRRIDLAAALAKFGDQLTKYGKSAEAEPLLRECLKIREEVLVPSHWRIAAARSLLGGSLAEQGKFPEAEALLVAGHEGMSKGKGTLGRQLAEALDRIVKLYDKWGKPEQADAWRKKNIAPGK